MGLLQKSLAAAARLEVARLELSRLPVVRRVTACLAATCLVMGAIASTGMASASTAEPLSSFSSSLSPTDQLSSGSAPIGNGGSLTGLDLRRRDLLREVYDYYANSVGIVPVPASECSSQPSVKLGFSDLNNGRKSTEDDYLSMILATFALYQHGEVDAAAVEQARQLLRWQMYCQWPGDGLGFNDPPFHLGVRTTAMRIYLLYRNLLAPEGTNQDLEARLGTRMRSGAQGAACTYSGNPACNLEGARCGGGTENHCAVTNSFNMLSAQLDGVPPEDGFWRFRRDEILRFLSAVVEKGMQEWGSGYQHWTWAAILNLAEFSSDAQVRELASMALEHSLAIQAGQSSPAGFFASGSVRSYPWQILGGPQWQSIFAQVLFTGGDVTADREVERNVTEMAVSNYQPLVLVDELYRGLGSHTESRFEQQGYIRSRNKVYLHHNYRGDTFNLAANASPGRNYYGAYDTVIAFLKADKNNESRVAAVGFHPVHLTPEGARIETSRKSQRAFGFRNVVIYGHGGLNPTLMEPRQPPRLYVSSDFQISFANRSGFGNNDDGTGGNATWFAWTCEGIGVRSDGNHMGGIILRSKTLPENNEGLTCVLEAADASMYPNFQAFKSDVLARNGSFNGRNYWLQSIDGADPQKIRFTKGGTDGGTYIWKVDGQEQEVNSEHFPRAEIPGWLDGHVLRKPGSKLQVTFDLTSGSMQGDTDRVPSAFQFGDSGIDPPADQEAPTVEITTPAEGQTLSGDFVATGFALDASRVDLLRFELDGAPFNLDSFSSGLSWPGACSQAGNVDPDCPNVGFEGLLRTSTLSSGAHTLRAIATDPNGNVAVEERSFFVDNTSLSGELLVPVQRESFTVTGTCSRSNGVLLGERCLETGEASLVWSSGNCEFEAGGITNRSLSPSPNCWGDLPFVFRRGSLERESIGGLREIAARGRVLFDRPGGGSGAGWMAVGFHSGGALFHTTLKKTGRWELWQASVLRASGQISGFSASDWHSLQLSYDRITRKARVSIDGVARGTVTLPAGTNIQSEFAGFHIGFEGSQTVGDFLADDFEVLADAVADTAVLGGRTYHLLKPTAWTAAEAIGTLGLGGHLATIGSVTERDSLMNQWSTFDTTALGLPACGSVSACPRMCEIGSAAPDGFWIGYNRANGPWGWISGSTSTFTDWATQQPGTNHVCSTGTEAAEYSGMVVGAGGTWSSWRDEPLANAMGIIERD